MLRFTRRSTLLAAGLLVACLPCACSDYEFRVNERIVYTPLPLFSDFETGDPALHDCLLQAISDQKIVRVDDLTQLSCEHAGIVSIAGLGTFRNLQWLQLANNALSELTPLAELSKLQVLDLSQNRLEGIGTLATLPELTEVDLRGNASLDCRQARTLATQHGFRVRLPAHCTADTAQRLGP